MKIIKIAWKWKNTPTKRTKTEYAVLHHSASSVASASDIDRWHKNDGSSGIGYQFLIQKDGSIYEGRPLDTVGAHCLGYNACSIGICFEGDFELEMPTEKQYKAGRELLTYLKGIYPNIKVVGHKDLYATACPGKNFDINAVLNYTEETKVKEKIYNWTTACPEWSQSYIHKALELGYIKGDTQGNLNLTDTKIWCLVVMMRIAGIME